MSEEIDSGKNRVKIENDGEVGKADGAQYGLPVTSGGSGSACDWNIKKQVNCE